MGYTVKLKWAGGKETVLHGCESIPTVKVEEDCPNCHGRGDTYDGHQWQVCTYCNGLGTVEVESGPGGAI
jgi:DnaJ-class molecular chaperone